MAWWKPTTAVLCVFALFSAASAVEITVGERRIDVPLPEGFVVLTPEMSPYYESLNAYVGPNNVRFLTLIRQEEADAIGRDEDVEIVRYINIESERSATNASVTSAQFAELRQVIKGQLDELYAQAEEQLPQLVGSGNEAASEAMNADVNVQVGGLRPLPVHIDRADAISNSMYANVGGLVNGEDLGSSTIAATTQIQHVKDKILFFYIYADQEDLEWTRETADALASAVVAQNPLAPAEREADENSGSSGFNWDSVRKNALIGGIIGGVVGLLSYLRRRRQEEAD